MALFGRRPLEAVGVDIGTSSVKVMELQRSRFTRSTLLSPVKQLIDLAQIHRIST